ncbi:MAG: type II toxin-antitoxin system RelE/ParE family toxin [Bacteroidetes bacterium]|nr:type II toxin-antitoxin system RelE/ParE family toxin [Bacteroidota bacterium]
MPFSYNLSREAEDDILEAYIWYEQQKSGLGEEFLDSLDKARYSILQNPATYRIRYKKKVRAYLVDRFPYLILYVVEKNEVNVISVFNTSRDPKVWKKRAR